MQKRRESKARSDEVMSCLQQAHLGNGSSKNMKQQTEETPAGEKRRLRGFWKQQFESFIKSLTAERG